MLKKAGSKRRFGFSIEGHAVSRDEDNPRKIVKSKVISVAISPAPKNPISWFEPIAASLVAALRKDGIVNNVGEIGYPVQGQAASDGMAMLVPQSMQGVPSNGTFDPKLLNGMNDTDLMVLRVLKKMPTLSWTQGLNIVKQLSSKVARS